MKETVLIVILGGVNALLFTRGILDSVEVMFKPTHRLSRDQVVDILYEVVQDSPKLKANLAELLAPLQEELMKAEPVVPLTPVEFVAVTIWFVFIGWLSWKAVDFFI